MFYFLTINMCQVRFCFCKLKETLLRISIKFKETSYGSYRVRKPDYVRNWYQIIYDISQNWELGLTFTTFFIFTVKFLYHEETY